MEADEEEAVRRELDAIAKVRAIGKAMRDAKIEVKKKLQDNQI